MLGSPYNPMGQQHMMGGPVGPGGGHKHSTMDSATQNMALQQLRAQQEAQARLQNLQNKLPLPGETYVSPENLRDAANRMQPMIFNR